MNVLVQGLLTITSAVLVFISVSCRMGTSVAENQLPLVSLEWQVDSIQIQPQSASYITLTIRNESHFPLENDEWKLYFSDIEGHIDPPSLPPEITVENQGGDFYELTPQETFPSLAAGKSYKVRYKLNSLIKRKSDAANGFFLLFKDKPVEVASFQLTGIDAKNLDDLGLPDPLSRYAINERLGLLDEKELPLLIPTPYQVDRGEGQYIPDGNITLSGPDGWKGEIEFLKNSLDVLTTSNTRVISESGMISLIESSIFSEDPEAYELSIGQEGIQIRANSSGGAFYGVQTLLNLLPASLWSEPSAILAWPLLNIRDKPRFAYRGLHFDVARHFHSLDVVRKLLRLMAQYKLNKFHFHLTDDEGWRLQIPGLPELTEVGGFRGYSSITGKYLTPSYGSGSNPEQSRGSGYYTREEFIELLRYAADLHIEVIPEIGGPAHARAAIKSMEYRYKQFMEEGRDDEAKQYLLTDWDDQSEYRSAQNFTDNVICVCLESTYAFMDHVYQEVANMYQEADVPLTAIHTGGDEVPYGAWQKSPICQKFIEENDNLKSTDDLNYYYVSRLRNILGNYGLRTAGWEEITLKRTAAAHEETDFYPEMAGDDLIIYVWNAVAGWGREDMAYKLANTGFPVVMGNSASFYFDMAYNRDPNEIGLSWSGYTDTESAFSTEPYDLFLRMTHDVNGAPLANAYLNQKERLTDEGRKNILGIQGQLWSETVMEDDLIYYLIFPKIFGLMERAWAPQPAWADTKNKATSDALYHESWNVFANLVGQKELIRMDGMFEGIPYRLPLPGILQRGNTIYANIQYPGLTMRYTLDGSEPDQNSPIYQGPLKAEGDEVRMKSFSTNGRSSRTSTLKLTPAIIN